MAAQQRDRLVRIVPIPEILPPVHPTPYVPIIRHPPGTPWTAPPRDIQELEPPYQTLDANGVRPALTTPYNAPRELVPPSNIPVWPTPANAPAARTPAARAGAPNTPARPSPWWEPGTFPAQPFNTPVPIRVHPYILYNPVNPLVPMLRWDILHRAEQARVLTGRQVLIPAKLNVQAVLPNVSKIFIDSDHSALSAWMEDWGPIMVEKATITIRDILDVIHEYFQEPLTEREFQRITSVPNNLTRLTISAHKRANDAPDLNAFTMSSGFRRIDAMGGHRRFQGLRPMVFQNNTWRLLLGLLPL